MVDSSPASSFESALKIYFLTPCSRDSPQVCLGEKQELPCQSRASGNRPSSQGSLEISRPDPEDPRNPVLWEDALPVYPPQVSGKTLSSQASQAILRQDLEDLKNPALPKCVPFVGLDPWNSPEASSLPISHSFVGEQGDVWIWTCDLWPCFLP